MKILIVLLVFAYGYAFEGIYRNLAVRRRIAHAYSAQDITGLTRQRCVEQLHCKAEEKETKGYSEPQDNISQLKTFGASSMQHATEPIGANKTASKTDINRILAEQGLSWADIEHMRNEVISEPHSTSSDSSSNVASIASEPESAAGVMNDVGPVRSTWKPATVSRPQPRPTTIKHLGTTLSTKSIKEPYKYTVERTPDIPHSQYGAVQNKPTAGTSVPRKSSLNKYQATNNTSLENILTHLIDTLGFSAMY